MFDLIIANPPYGKSGTMATKILRVLLQTRVTSVVLCQLPSADKPGVREHVKDYKVTDNIFDAGLGKLGIFYIDPHNVYEHKEVFGKRCLLETDILYNIKDFNKGSERKIESLDKVNRNRAKYESVLEEGRLFMFGNFDLHTVRDPVTHHSHIEDWNYYRDRITWATPGHCGSECRAFDFGTKHAKENFRDVYFDVPEKGFWSAISKQTDETHRGYLYADDIIPFIDYEHLDEHPLWNTSKELAFLMQLLQEGGSKIVAAYLRTKGSGISLNASEVEIIAELKDKAGLPKDWEL